jgi:peptidylprolyl isomerase
MLLAFAVACGEPAPIVEEPVETPVTDPAAATDAPADVAAPPTDAKRTESGLAYKVLTQGKEGASPTPKAKVTVHYTGWTTDGAKFDSSVDRKKPATFGLRGVIKGWTEGLQLMVPGDKFRFWIPEDLAYKGRPGKPAGMLVFDVELISVDEPPEAPPAPETVAAAPKDAIVTSSGLAYQVVETGDGGDKPTEHSVVTVQYTGWTVDGEQFDSSVPRQRPATFPLTGVIAGWTEGVQFMSPGDTYLFWIPEELAYQGQPGKPAGMLVFQIELLKFTTPPPPPEAPADVAAAPSDAKKTASGLAYKVLSTGDGGDKPAATARVQVHYTGWTTDGKMFDSSVPRQKPATFPLNRVIAGWTEGLQLMSPGDSYRFWIPEELAYQGQPGKPAGMLVFDVELLTVK